MRTTLYMIAFFLLGSEGLQAQQFVKKAVIEYEVKTNFKKTLGNNMWDEMMKENLSQFKTSYYKFTFADNKSIYKFDRWAADTKIPEWKKKNDESNVWYFDHDKGRINMLKTIIGSDFNVDDSIPVIEWRLSNESRVIAGYNCRKATGKIMDSVYVFAFYSDEITISGGPCSISGLPGMILGLTIPRMYTSWIATKVEIDKGEEKDIVPVKAKKYYTGASLNAFVKEHTKDWFSEDDPDSKKEIQQFYWEISL